MIVKKTASGVVVLADDGQPIVAAKQNRCKIVPFDVIIECIEPDTIQTMLRDLVKITVEHMQKKNFDKFLTALMEYGIDHMFEAKYGFLTLTSIMLSDKQLNEM